MEVFQDYAYYYNAFYEDKDYKKEAAQVDSMLKRFGGANDCSILAAGQADMISS